MRALFLTALAFLALAASAGAQQPAQAPPLVLDGPSPAITGSTGLASAIARDGTGGLVYLKQVGGVPHVFTSLLVGGSFQRPIQVDGGLLGGSSQPVIAASNGGALIVGYINGGSLYVVSRTSGATPLSPPRGLIAGASNPSLSMTIFDKAYLAFTVPDGAGTDVRALYYNAGQWALEPTPLNASAADAAGVGSGRPAVAAANDGVGIVAWGENGHVFTRRVWGTSPSVAIERADGSLPGCTDLSADEPAIGSGGDSSYAAVAFHEMLSCAGGPESRVLYDRLRGSAYDGVQAADGLPTPTSGSADAPRVAIGEYGKGWVTSTRTTSPRTVAIAVGSNEGLGGGLQVNSQPQSGQSYAIPGTAGYYSSFVAWQQDPGAGGQPEIRARIADNGNPLGPELVLSSRGMGPTNAAAGLAAGGDVSGEAAVAWVQTTSSGNAIVTDQLYQPPGAPAVATPHGYQRTTRPALVWQPSSEPWGPVRYRVGLDGSQIAQTSANAFRLPGPLSQGRHTWSVRATNPAGQTSGASAASFFVDTIAPKVRLTLSGRRRAGARLHLHVIDTDAPPPLPAGEASGIARVLVRWGDHTPASVIAHWRYHVYKKPGRYRLTVSVTDRAGNTTRMSLVVVIHKGTKPRGGA